MALPELPSVLRLPVQLAESALLVFGVRIGTEEPPHSTQDLGDGVQLRHYQARIAAETTVTAGEEAARNAGFRRLAGYIFGGNRQRTKIDMTAPVAQQVGVKIAMTAPVAQSSASGDDWVIRFYLPSRWTMAELPLPDDDRVRLVEVPAETYGVLRFTGDRQPSAVAAKTTQLQNALHAYGFDATGDPIAWFYDPPWTLPFLRRNEVAIPVS